MSIAGAVAELNKEIERLTKIRDSLYRCPLQHQVSRQLACQF